jgi:hypothetical protein
MAYSHFECEISHNYTLILPDFSLSDIVTGQTVDFLPALFDIRWMTFLLLTGCKLPGSRKKIVCE